MNKLLLKVLAVFAAFFTYTTVSAQHKADDIVGYWLNQDKDAKIEISKQGNKYFGKIVWLATPIDPETNKPKVDKNNPEKSLRTRPTLGLEILKSFVFDGKQEWNDGSIYDPKSGKTYDCFMKFESSTSLKIRGYVGISLLGKTTIWTKTTLQ
jgi:uncharacterized protein (DUF2147 family)